MITLFGILLTTILGLLISLMLSTKGHPIGRIALAYILGLGLDTLIMSGFLFGRIPLSRVNLLGVLIILNLFLGFTVRERLKRYLGEMSGYLSLKNFSRFEKLLLLILLLINLSAIFISCYWPVKDWDAVTLYDFRAKLIANPETATNFINIKYMTYYYGYPLLTSLAHAFVYILGGHNPQFLSGLFFNSLTILFYGSVREFSSRKVGLLMTLALITNYSFIQHASTAYTNLPFSVYFAIGTIYLYNWMQKKETGDLLISSLLIMLSIWVRDSEPFWIANLIILVFYAFWEKKILAPIIYSIIVLPIRFIWGSFKDRVSDYVTSNQFQTGFSILSSGFDLGRMVQIVGFLGLAIFPLFLPVIILFICFLLIDFKKLFDSKRIYLILLIVLNFGVLFVGSYVFSFTYKDWMRIPGSVERIFMFFPILLLFYVATVLGGKIEDNRLLGK